MVLSEKFGMSCFGSYQKKRGEYRLWIKDFEEKDRMVLGIVFHEIFV